MINPLICKKSDEFIEIRFQCANKGEFDDTIARIKSIWGRQFVPAMNCWMIPITQERKLKQLFSKIEWESTIEIDLSIKEYNDDITYFEDMTLPPYPFQVLGANFLVDNKTAIVGDEMGLGKSFQILGAVYKLYKQGKISSALIICPSALKYQWAEELEKFIDIEKEKISFKVLDGTPKKRAAIYDEIREEKSLFVFANYELITNDIDIINTFKWDVVAFDEAHRLKNNKAKTTIAARKLKSEYKWMSTGTPVQNRPEELFSLFEVMNPKILGSFWTFRNKYIIIGTKFNQKNMILGYKNLAHLNAQVNPYMIRRLKKDVAPELPSIITKDIYVEMHKEQHDMHERVRDELIELIKETSDNTERDENGSIIKQDPRAGMTQGMFIMMQELCDDPSLLKESDSKMAQGYSIKSDKSPKLEALIELLKEQKEVNPEQDIVIFTQFARMQNRILKAIENAGLGECAFVNGSLNAVKKQEQIVKFKLDPTIHYMVATDSLNYGSNLQNSTMLINYDIPWNPATYSQRAARIHRLSSTSDSVTIVNMIAKDGIDERILDVMYSKKEMADDIIETTDKERKHLSRLTNKAMSKLLSKKKKKTKEKSGA